MLLLGYIFVFGIWVNESTHGDVYMIHNLKREQGQFTVCCTVSDSTKSQRRVKASQLVLPTIHNGQM